MSCRCGATLTIPTAASSAKSLKCPNCGGPVSAHSNKCQFCETDLAVLNCPSCFSLQFLGTRFCSDCGTELNKPARAEHQNQLNCPRCETPLTTRSYDHGAVDHCESCGGLWLNHEIFERTVNHTREKANTSLQAKKPMPHTVFNNHPVTYLPCPECQSLMLRRNFAQRSGVIVDVCSSHGVWLDHKELSAILNFIREGGMKHVSPHQNAGSTLDAPKARENKSPYGVETTIRPDQGYGGNLGWSDIVDLIGSLPFFK